VKKIQDFYFKKAKKEGYPARSVYKLSEAQEKYRLLGKGDKVLDVGCQPGSWSLFAAKTIGPSGLVVGVDLKKGGDLQQRGGADIKFFCGDIMDKATEDMLRSVCARFDVIVSDMAPNTTGNKWADQQKSLTLSRHVLELSERLLAPGGNFYCKVFEGEDFREFVSNVHNLFKMAKVVKPKSSRSESREVFVLGMGYAGVGEERLAT